MKKKPSQPRTCCAVRLMALAATLIGLGGCATQRDFTEQSTKANLSVEDAHNRILLLNVVRAMRGRPLYFTGFSSLKGPLGAGSPTLGFNIPFGNDLRQNIYQFIPSFKPDVAQYDIAIYDRQEFVRGIAKPVTPATLQFYLDQGWPLELLLHLFIREVEVFKGDRKIESRINYPPNWQQYEAFLTWVREIGKCELYLDVQYGEPTNVGPQLPRTAAEDITKLIALRKEGFELAPVPGSSVEGKVEPARWQLRKVHEIPVFKMKQTKDCPQAGRSLFNVTDLGATPVLGLARAEEDEERTVIYMRSPEGMVKYLGEVARAQLEGARVPGGGVRPLTVTIMLGSPLYTPPVAEPLFVLRESEVDTNNSVVRVEYDGRIYGIPQEPNGRSMHVLALISSLIGLNRSSSEVPQSTTIRLLQ